MIPRIYQTFFENITVAAVQDLFYVKAGASNGIALRGLSLSAGNVTVPAEIRLRLKRLPATVTVGSGGTAPTIAKTDSLNGTSAASAVRANDTTQATTSGTAVTLLVWQWNVLQDFLYVPTADEERERTAVSEALVFDVVATPASTVLSGWIKWAEYP